MRLLAALAAISVLVTGCGTSLSEADEQFCSDGSDRLTSVRSTFDSARGGLYPGVTSTQANSAAAMLSFVDDHLLQDDRLRDLTEELETSLVKVMEADFREVEVLTEASGDIRQVQLYCEEALA